ncbi:ammonium transporter AmtB-like domain-containing protein, partial [Lineolata rhizophorae]
DFAWMLTSSALVLVMVPGLSLFYSGIADNRVMSSMAWYPLMTTAIIGLQWYLWGYTITFSDWPSSHTFWGGSDGVALHNVLLRPVPSRADFQIDGPYIPELLYALFQGMFACFTASLVSGTAARKDRPGHFMIFLVLWATFVYDPIARWTWSPNGWSKTWGVLDFAGGTAVHVTAGATVLAHCTYTRYVLPFVEEVHMKILLGTGLLWIGWLGFNGGSALGANLRAVSACVSTHLAACAGGVTFCLLHAFWFYLFPDEDDSPTNMISEPHTFKWSMEEFCNGVMIGLVCITPAAGYVPLEVAPVFGIGGALMLFFLTGLNFIVNELQDEEGIIVIHGIGGMIGMVFTGLFARGEIPALDGKSDPGESRGGWDGNWRQLGIQIADAFAALGYAFSVTMVILLVLEPFIFL